MGTNLAGTAMFCAALATPLPAPHQPIPPSPPPRPSHSPVSPPRRTSIPALHDMEKTGDGPRRIIRQVNVTPDQLNIIGDAALSPTIAVDPTAPNRIVIGWSQFDSADSPLSQAGYGWSTDGGRTWHAGVIAPGDFHADPVLEADRDGRFYYLSRRTATENALCDIARSLDGGRTWPQLRDAYGGVGAWFVIDRSTDQGGGHVYQTWSNCCGPFSQTTFSRSTDLTESWESPQAIPGPPLWGTLAVGPSGELYAVGAHPNGTRRGAAILVRSFTARDPSQPVTFESPIPIDVGGDLAVVDPNGPNPGGILGRLWIAVDTGPGPRRGHIYICATVDPPGDDPADVCFIRSTNGGRTWSAPRRINSGARGPGEYQWFGAMSVSRDGRIDLVWNDTSGTSESPRRSRLVYSSSNDGGVTWTPAEPITAEWDSWTGWTAEHSIGSSYHMRSDLVGADLAMAATFNGELDIFYMRIGDFDCNANNIGDTSELSFTPELDCDENQVIDSCEIAAGAAPDVNADGRIDTCQCLADWNSDGVVNSADISAFLAHWTTGAAEGSTIGDYNADGVTNSADVSAFLAGWAAAANSDC